MPATTDNRLTIILATSNRDKVKELRPLLENISSDITVHSLNEIGVNVEIEETEATLEGNALLKARAIFNLLSERFPFLIALADDTGLEVDALNGAPGVYSARFAPMPDGLTPAYKDNVLHLLRSMKGIANREARFRTVVALKGVLPSSAGCFEFEHTAEGVVPGSITLEEQGNAGFGYDPLFLVHSTGKTYAEMSMEEKNRLSHRSLAVQHAIDYLKTLLQQISTLSNDTKTHP
ncbi:MAG: RdgB/HAM1 family non-canonical purine NTP pyrophosphatase [Chlorobiaceae bacterium]|jgi:XTP/dITP diphosphohydrolase|nr:RdgB/HAM1 family non-canonical purine NTP pyrophosphatase [Chlorobiaceae bacterium]NTV16242.1 RdgB/HAM1 family non-canonical purine NTP pyrophosphatase [Chlorobiaceae bacterium]